MNFQEALSAPPGSLGSAALFSWTGRVAFDCRLLIVAAGICMATPSVAGPSDGGRIAEPVPRQVIAVVNDDRQEPDIDTYALMSGKCTTLKIGGQNFACKAVAYFHSQQGRAHFTVVLDDPKDASHIISFSGENGRREQDNVYELEIDRMLLNSRDRPKVDGLPVPFAELSAGKCKQLGILATRQVSSISCAATDKNGKTYELQFESDGSPITLRKIRQSPLTEEKRRARQVEQLECRRKADIAKVLPRDWTAFVIRCLADDGQKPPAAAQQ
jgi:hypothetical protein